VDWQSREWGMDPHRSSPNFSTLFRKEQPAGSSALSFLEIKSDSQGKEAIP